MKKYIGLLEVQVAVTLMFGFVGASRASSLATFRIRVEKTTYTLVKENPYEQQKPLWPNPESLSVNLRIVDEGVRNRKDFEQMIAATELIYSQCPNVDFHVNVQTELVSRGHFRPTEAGAISSKSGNFIVPQDLLNSFATVERVPGVVDVHLVDHLTEENRSKTASGEQLSYVYLGKSFPEATVKNYLESENGPLSSVQISSVANTLLLAMDTNHLVSGKYGYLGQSEIITRNGKKELVPHRKMARLPQGRSLLAHELGHILFEAGDHINPVDHYCPGLNKECPEEYVMSAGGSKEFGFYQPNKLDRPVGFTPLPLVDPQQCEFLKNHPLVSHAQALHK
jgi:hypothetical protein